MSCSSCCIAHEKHHTRSSYSQSTSRLMNPRSCLLNLIFGYPVLIPISHEYTVAPKLSLAVLRQATRRKEG
jgi:hypothetical protein